MSGPGDAFPARYEIRIGERLSPKSARWFEGMTVTVVPPGGAAEDGGTGQTVLRGTVRDSAALYGLVARVRDLGLTLVSVQRLERKEGDPETT